jgi:tight adherence protein B
MYIAIAIFVVLVGATVFLFTLGLIVPTFGDQRRTRKLLRRRLAQIESELGGQSAASLMREKYLRDLSRLQRRLEGLPGMEALALTIEQSGGGTLLAHQVVAVAVLLSAAGAFAAGTMFHSAPVAAVGACGGALLPFLRIRYVRNQRLAKLEEQLPDAIDVIRRALRAGHPLPGCLKLVAEDMPQPIAREFELAFGDINYGNDVRRAFLGLLERVPSVTMMSFVTAVLVQRETGGNLAEVLDQISRVVRGRFKFYRKVRTLSAEGRMSAWVLALVPLGLFALISYTSPGYLPVLTHDPLGRKLITAAVALGLVGVLWIRKLLRIEV